MRFRVGDIAEVQITVVAVPIRHEKYKMLVQLRSIALLDGRFTDVRTHPEFKKYYADVTKIMQEAAAVRSNVTNGIKATQVKIKRKVGYDEDDDKEMSEARQKLVNMRMKE